MLAAALSMMMTLMMLGEHTANAMVSNSDNRCRRNQNLVKTTVASTNGISTRQELLHGTTRAATAAALLLSSGGLLTAIATSNMPANAFDNRISDQYKDRPKQRGSKPKELGVAKRMDLYGNEYSGLKPCGRAPNCFVSSSNDAIDEQDDFDRDHTIPSWKWPSTMNEQQAFEELVSTLKAYQPGQSNVDGGGFQLSTVDPKAGYVYMQFESLKNGYIDDVEFAVLQGALQVRSSSRLGYLDFGVNAKRLNFIASTLREKGWNAPGVDYKTHQNYAIQNEVE